MKPNYSKYHIEELVNDDFFIQSIKKPSSETDAFWKQEIDKNPSFKNTFYSAKDLILNISAHQEQMTNDEFNTLWSKIEKTNIRTKKNRTLRKTLFYSAAISILAFIAIPVYLILDQESVENTFVMTNEEIQDEIVLVLGDKKEIINTQKDVQISHSSEGETKIDGEIIESQAKGKETNYNQLIVPYGRRAELTLADGTKLWVNAGTKVVYPTDFKNKREINVSGEVFLDITPDKKKPFIVKTEDFSVEVLGTSFNVMSYPDSNIEKSVALVNGAVKINSSGTDFTLKPEELFTKKGEIQKVKKTDISKYTLWIEGIYQFKSKKLAEVMSRISRYYGVSIECESQCAELICNGKLDMKDDLERVLNGVAKAAEVSWQLKNGEYKIFLNNN